MKRFKDFSEDLRKWFDKKDPQGGWKRIGTDGSVLGPCARPDKDGDGEIDLKEILLLESELESEKAQAGRMRKALCAVVLLVIMLLGMMLAMGVAAVEFTKETAKEQLLTIVTNVKILAMAISSLQ